MRKLLLYGLTGVMLLSNTAYATNNDTEQMIESSLEVETIDESKSNETKKEEVKVADIHYNENTGVLEFTPKLDGTTYYAYKINGEYPKYQSSKVVYVDGDGKPVKEEEVDPEDTVFKDDFTGWKNIEERDSIPSFVYVADDADAYIEFQQVPKGDKTASSICIGYPIGAKVTIMVVNKDENGNYSNVQTEEFTYKGTVIEEDNFEEKLEVIERGQNYEIVRISAKDLAYVEKWEYDYYEPEDGNNYVDIKLTENMEYTFEIGSKAFSGIEVIKHTVSGLTPVIEGSEAFDPNGDLTPPTITSDPIPETATEGFTFKIYTDEVATIQCDGKEVEGTELELYVDCNTYYNVIAIDKSGNKSEKFFEFKCFKEDNPNGWVDGDNKDVILTDVTNIPEDEVIDRNSYFEGFKDLLGELPLTGLVSYTTILLVGLGVIGTGVAGLVLLNKKKLFKKKDNVEEN